MPLVKYTVTHSSVLTLLHVDSHMATLINCRYAKLRHTARQDVIYWVIARLRMYAHLTSCVHQEDAVRAVACRG